MELGTCEVDVVRNPVSARDQHAWPERRVIFLLQMLATIQVVFFYIARVPSYLNLNNYEHGLERMPFQGRMLMAYPLLWAHRSTLFSSAAGWLTAALRSNRILVTPEDVVEGIINVLAVTCAGFVARELYRRRSLKGHLLAYVYPVFLAMVAVSYCLSTFNFFRYVYDLPSVGLFAAGLFFIYRGECTVAFAITFAVATLNRETSIFLLWFFIQHRCLDGAEFKWRRMATLPVGGVAIVLGLFWAGFHAWLGHHYGPAHSDVKPGALTNLLILLWPVGWPQLAGIGAYTLPLLLLLRRRQGPVSRQAFDWMWVLPMWAASMLVYGSILEIRLFGELLPLFASTAVLAAETQILQRDAADASASHSAIARC